MANYKDSDSHQGVFISLIPSEQITPGSFDETVNLLVDHVLDLSDFDADYNNDHGGASAYPPAALLKIILAAYYRGITGSRKIENLCRHHTTFMALSGFLTPDHATIAAFVSKSPERLESLFLQIVLECDYLGLIGGEVFAIDGSKISSNASKEWSGTRADFERKYTKIRRAIRRMLQRHREEDLTERVDSDVREREAKQIEKLRQAAIRKGRSDNPPRPLDLMKDKIDSVKGRVTYSDRIGIIEPVFAHIKHTLGLDWFSLRGRQKVKGQWLLWCMIHNMVKIQRYGEYEAA